MMIDIKEMSIDDNLLISGWLLPPLGAYHIRHSQTREGAVLGAVVDERVVGIAVADYVPETRLAYVFVEEAFRMHGIGTLLVRAVLDHAQAKSEAMVNAYVILQNQFGEVADNILRKAGFKVTDTATIIRYASDALCSSKWAAFMKERGTRICGALERRGFTTLTFSEAPAEMLEKLKVSIGSEFDASLDPFRYISNQNDRIVPDYSFITLKDDDPAAFIKVTTADEKSLVFQHISIAFKYQGSGVFILPFAAFMKKFLEGGVYVKGAAVVYDRNEKMQRLMHSFIGSLSESMKTQNTYQYKL